MGIKKLNFLLIIPIFLARSVSAHCPLCTITAGAAATGAVWLGVSKIIIGLLMGAFAMSMGMWFSRIPKIKYIPFQRTAIISIVFLLTILPLLPIFSHVAGFHVDLTGGYGSLLNRTYVIDHSLLSSFLGGAIVFISPALNKKIKEKRNGKSIPFQGIIIIFLLIVIASLIIQFAF